MFNDYIDVRVYKSPPGNNNGRNGSWWLATSLEEKRRWLIINASHEDNVQNKFRIGKERHIQMRENRSSHLVG